jgi:hypothetical protein
MAGSRRTRRVEPSPTMKKLVELLQREVGNRVGANSTFEQRQDAATAFVAELLDKAVEEDQGDGPVEVTHVQGKCTNPKG